MSTPFTLQLTPETYNLKPEIQVFDIYGQLLQTVETRHGTSLQIDLSHYATGIYFVRMVNGGKVMAVRKVVKGR
ncbi:MAG: T9SS type A sorting domain-containing protein [Bacteroidales bacterium]|nr:T9SS type A sorting domain-containing protein [Bacteroidales bacterium]